MLDFMDTGNFSYHFKAKSLHCLKPSVKLASVQSYWMNVFGRKSQKDPCPRSRPTVDGGKRRAMGGDTQWEREPVMPSEHAGTCLKICQILGLPTEFKMGALSQFYFTSQMTQTPSANPRVAMVSTVECSHCNQSRKHMGITAHGIWHLVGPQQSVIMISVVVAVEYCL